MKKVILLLFVSQSVFAQHPAEKKPEQGERHEFVIANFPTEIAAFLVRGSKN